MLQVLDLLDDFSRDGRVAVAAIHDGDAGEAVEVFLAFTVVQVLHGSFDEFHRLLVEMAEAGHDVFLLFLNDGFRPDILVFSQDEILLFYGRLVESAAFSDGVAALTEPVGTETEFARALVLELFKGSSMERIGSCLAGGKFVECLAVKLRHESRDFRRVILCFDAVGARPLNLARYG